MNMHINKKLWVVVVSLVAVPAVVMATPGAGFVFNFFNRFTSVTDEIHEHARDKHWSAELEVEGATDFVQQDVMLAPGGFSGWHSHPGPVIITVKSGTATWYSADDQDCTPKVYPTGSAFIEPANVHHYVANEGSDNLELLPTYIIPKGKATRQEQPQPSQCPF
ncbi:MAG TPA: cupin domain-containing protein [Terriglobales bacterium]|nr:cupin domain-containing protein [Terriglobales bacterium]